SLMSDSVPPPLIGSDDPSPATTFHAEGRAPAVVLCDHAGRAIPKALDRLGLPEEQLDRHIAWDIGAADVTRRLAMLLDAPAVLSTYSRLLVDLNRGLDDPTLIPAISDGTVVPGNRSLDAADVERRLAAFSRPYHEAIARVIAGMWERGVPPAVISIHSFTPVMHDFHRPWHVGILWDQDPRIPVPLMEKLRRDPGLYIGDNQPYSGRNTGGGTIETHATPAGLPNALIEIRQDLIDTPAKAFAWAERLAGPLSEILADPELYRVEFFP
ncbi:MAG TPA: N-formylglutamate amidohydrolase, partial [Azospirillaceae bacterium]|nr:N-formylglutamate amidohydrolase [Azospirillaceae bacterium]